MRIRFVVWCCALLLALSWGAKIASAAPLPLHDFSQEGDAFSNAFSPDGKRIAMTSLDIGRQSGQEYDATKFLGSVHIRDVESGRELKTLTEKGFQILDLAWSPDGKTLATFGTHFEPRAGQKDEYDSVNLTRLWDVENGASLAVLPDVDGTSAISFAGFSKDGGALRLLRYKARPARELTLESWDAKSASLQSSLKIDAANPENAVLSPDARVLAVAIGKSGGWAAAIEKIELRDAENGALLHALTRADGVLELLGGLSWSADGKTLAVAAAPQPEDKTRVLRGEVQLWNAATGRLEKTIGPLKSLPHNALFSPDGKTLAVGENGVIRLWNVVTNEVVRVVGKMKDDVSALAWSPDARTLVSGNHGGAALWDATGTRAQDDGVPNFQTLDGHVTNVTALAFSPDGKTLASGSARDVDYSERGRQRTGGSGEIIVWDLTKNEPQRVLKGHKSFVESLSWAPDNVTLLSAADWKSHDETALLWNVRDGSNTALRHGGSVLRAVYSPDGKTIALGGEVGEGEEKIITLITLRDAASGAEKRVFTVPQMRVREIVWTADGKQIALCGSAVWGGKVRSDEIRVWDVASGKELFALRAEKAQNFQTLAFSPDARVLAVGGGRRTANSDEESLQFFDAQNGKLLRSVPADDAPFSEKQPYHIADIRSLAFSPDGKWLAVNGLGSRLRVLDATSGATKLALTTRAEGSGPVAFAPDGKTLAAASSYHLRLWDLAQLDE